MKTNVIIFMDGGLIQGILVDQKNINVVIIDQDIDGLEADELNKLTDMEGKEFETYINRFNPVEYAPKDVANYGKQIKAIRKKSKAD